jgi:hypothetical protein
VFERADKVEKNRIVDVADVPQVVRDIVAPLMTARTSGRQIDPFGHRYYQVLPEAFIVRKLLVDSGPVLLLVPVAVGGEMKIRQ